MSYSLVTALGWTSLVLACLVLPFWLYLACLSLVSVRSRQKYLGTQARFAFVVPAHNEAAQIAKTVASLKQVDYPAERFRVVVVADNCSDATAHLAQEAGAQVIERQHATLRGKGYALEHAFERLVAPQEQLDALVVVDADTLVERGLLQAFAGALQNGAQAVQGNYGVSNPQASWRTRLIVLAMAMFHRLRSLGRERLGVSAGLRGNGMCFTTELLRRIPHQAFGLVEDVEYGIALGRAGIRVVYADAACVYGEMVADAAGSRSQRQRWEGGRMALVKRDLPRLAWDALRRGDAILLDLALDLAVPPLSTLGLGLVLGTAVAAAHLALAPAVARPCWELYVWGSGWLGLAFYVGRGMVLSGLGFGAVTALCWAPVYVVWKLLLKLRPGSRSDAWVRTKRQGE